MQCIHVATTLDSRYGGPPKVAIALTAALGGIGVQSVIFSTCANGLSRGVRSSSVVGEFARTWPSSWYRAPLLARHLRTNSAVTGLIHVHEIWSHPQYAATAAAVRHGIPYLITPHGELDQRHLHHGGPLKQLKKRFYLRLIANRILRGAACLHAINTSEAEELIEAGFCKNVTVIPNGVDLAEFANLPAPEVAEERWPMFRDKRVVLFLSRLSPEKGLDELVPAWKQIQSRPSFSDTILVLAGPDSHGYERAARRLIHEHDLADSVVLTGMVSGSEKLALMNRADLYVLPSYGEGFSMSVLENLAVGNPVLITPGCNFPEVVEAGAGMCVEPSAGEVAEGLRTLLDLSDEERSILGKNGRDLVAAKYTWNVQARKMLTVYRCILDGSEIPLYPAPADP